MCKGIAGHSALDPSLLAAPPKEHRVKDALAVAPENRQVKVQHVIQLLVENSVIGSDTAVHLVAQTSLNAVHRVGGIPLQIAVALAGVAMLQAFRLPLA